MAGPTATVLLPRPLSEHDVASLCEVVNSVSDRDLDQPPDLNAFWICDTRSVGGRYRGDGRPFAIERHLQPSSEPGHLQEIAGAFGLITKEELGVIAFCNGDEDHQVLGEVVLHLAEQFGGVVDFGGALWPPVPRELLDMHGSDWRQIEPYFRQMVGSMPGKVIGLRYEPKPGREWVSHVGDVVFLRAWLEHPHFRMIK